MIKVFPDIITFTGVDDFTNPYEMVRLSNEYPMIEWGVLFSPKLQGTGRYPSLETVDRLAHMEIHTDHIGFQLAAHICGGHSRELIRTGSIPEIEKFLIPQRKFNEKRFVRVQINTADPDVQPGHLFNWGERLRLRVILQTRGDAFPQDNRVNWLYDRSGGRGEVPASFPPLDPATSDSPFCGFAGGITPDNVVEVLERIDAPLDTPYWIDMESGVRTDDLFDLAKCRRVCEAVWGAP
jgi:hypothetical protein